jgi:hypothetical protein
MSSGTDLLRQFQGRRRQQAQGATPASSTLSSSSAGAGGRAPSAGTTRLSSTSTSPIVSCSITVCTGINCGVNNGGVGAGGGVIIQQPSTKELGCGGGGGSGSGTSATLLEIEELVQEEFPGVMTVQSGGCTDHCTMGPNVFVSTTSLQGTGHFTKVNSVEACARVVHAGAKQVLPSCTNIMLRRAEGLRWKALRVMARESITIRYNSGCAGRDLLNQAVDAEVAALRSFPEQVARAERRRLRLLAVIDETPVDQVHSTPQPTTTH